MLNKELQATLTPTDEEGIFLLTVGELYTEGPSFAGFSDNGYFTPGEHFGELSADKPYIVKGTNSEYFDTNVTCLLETNGNAIEVSFHDKHKPNTSETVIYFHMKKIGIYGPISARLLFPVNKSFASENYVSSDSLNNLVGQTVRVYLGPSATPPQYL